MDKSWIKLPRNTPEYLLGLRGFLDFAFQHHSSAGTILCPCKSCGFKPRTRKEVWDHLTSKQFPEGYTFWCFHGEKESGEFDVSPPIIQENMVNEDLMSNIPHEDPMQTMINDAFEFSRMRANEEPFPSSTEHRDGGGGGIPDSHHGPTIGVKDFYDLLRDGEQPLYDGCTKYSKLSFLVKLYHIKILCQFSDKAMSMIIELLHDAFEHAKIPSSSYEARKLINKLGLDYIKIHACPNETEKEVSRGVLYIDTHKKVDGTYISEEARVVCEKIAEIESQGTASVAITPNDSLGQVLGKEHSGRVRCVGDGLCPSQLFGLSNPQISGPSTNIGEVQQLKNEVQQLKNEIVELRIESKIKDETMKMMASVLAGLLSKSSEPVPVPLLNFIQQQSAGGHSS